MKKPRIYKKDLEYSKDDAMFEEFYKEYFGELLDFTEVVPDDTEEQMNGTDKILHLKNGNKVRVDEKKRREDWDDVLIEIYSDLKNEVKGWIHHTQTDYMAYGFEKSGKVLFIPFLELQVWYYQNKNNLNRFQKVLSKNNGYSTLSVAVPIRVLRSELYRNFTM